MRTAVFNAHWPTLGGGEQVAGAIAAALARRDDVDLLVPETFDADRASERLGFDLTAFPQVEVRAGTRAFLDASERYDLVVNTSYANVYASRARRSLYYVHFPMPDPSQSALERWRWRYASPNPLRAWVEYANGFWLSEFPALGAWTRASARMDLILPRDLDLPFGLTLSADAWPVGRHPRVEVRVGGRSVFRGTVGPGKVRVQTTARGTGVDRPVAVEVTSDTFVPRLEHGSDDDRELGVVVSHAYLGRRLPALRPTGTGLGGVDPRASLTEFLATYGTVLANSPYTAEWVERRWRRSAEILSPPVPARAAGTKERVILSVGRFFRSESGHSKKQLELVEAFRIARAGGLDGWELHLVGGCAPVERTYVEDVRRAAVGLPVVFHVNAPGDDLDALFARASLFWHAAGIGEDLEHHPERFEHFGISVVEAMSAGAVPLVYEHGGPAAIVGSTACGRLFSSVEELAARTREFVDTPGEIDRLAARAQLAAEEYAFDRFAAHLGEIVAGTVSRP